MAKEVETTKDWEAEDDARTLMRAQEIKQDPKRLERAKKVLNKQRKAINSIADIEKEAGVEV